MACQDKVVYLSPLISPPDWASASLPSREGILELQHKVDDALGLVSKARMVLNLQPDPTPVVLRKIQDQPVQVRQVLTHLREMRYPPELTHWVDQARTLACKAAENLDCCFTLIAQVITLQIDIPSYSAHLNTARQLSKQAHQQLEKLDMHFEELLEALPIQPSHNSANNVIFLKNS